MSEENKGFEVPRDPKVLKELRDGLQQIKDSKVRAAGEREFQTEKIKQLVEITKIPNGTIRKLAGVVAEGGVDHLIQEVEDLEALFVAINNNLEAQIGQGHNLNPELKTTEVEIEEAIRQFIPNQTTIDAIDELERGGGVRFKDVDSLMKDLND